LNKEHLIWVNKLILASLLQDELLGKRIIGVLPLMSQCTWMALLICRDLFLALWQFLFSSFSGGDLWFASFVAFLLQLYRSVLPFVSLAVMNFIHTTKSRKKLLGREKNFKKPPLRIL